MISYVRLKRHKALSVGDLTRLGKINVICGANNTGKTTVLERLASTEDVFVGGPYDSEKDRDVLKEEMQRHKILLKVGGDSMTLLTFFGGATDIDETFKRTFDNFPIGYSDDHAIFADAFVNNALNIFLETNVKRRWRFNLQNLLAKDVYRRAIDEQLPNAFRPFFDSRWPDGPKPDEVVMVTPKRRIESSAAIATSPDVGPDGERLIQRLFLLKSQLPQTHGRRFFERYWAAFQEVTGSLKFDIGIDEATQRLRLSFSEIAKEEWRFADDCGLGLRELMTMLYFALNRQTKLVLIEEPENHLHPELQRRLLWYLKEKAEDSKQFILSTHSSVFLDNNFVDRIFQTALEDQKIVIADATSKARILNDLGYSVADNLVSDLIIVVEGSGDKNVITDFLMKKGVFGRNNIRFWILNGDAMGNVDLEALADRFSIVVLLDNDPASAPARQTFVDQCTKLDIPVTTLVRYSIENYFPLEVYKQTFGELIQEKQKGFDHKKAVWSQLGGQITRKDIKKGSKKFASRTTLGDIAGTDLEAFLNDIERRLPH